VYASKEATMKTVLIVISLGILFCTSLTGEDIDKTRDALEGVAEIKVVINISSHPELIERMMSKSLIQQEVESQLKASGIKIADSGAFLTLRLSMITFPDPSRDYQCLGWLDFGRVKREREPQTRMRPVHWRSSYIRRVSNSLDRRELEDIIRDEVDKFINAWLSVNPKPGIGLPKD
jgi:hypothetical protein